MKTLLDVCKFLKAAGTYYLATVDGDKPRVRPFGTAHIYNGKLYIQTGKKKAVSHQIAANPNVEICAMADGDWLRIEGWCWSRSRPAWQQRPELLRRHRYT